MTATTPRLTPADTKTRILDAAEALFVAGGFDAMSMRQITTTASVNLAAVNYHFGSKDALIQAVLARQLDPLNEARLAVLGALEADLAERMTCEHVLVAMFLPAVRMSRSGEPNAERFLHFLGRAYTANPFRFATCKPARLGKARKTSNRPCKAPLLPPTPRCMPPHSPSKQRGSAATARGCHSSPPATSPP